MSVEKIVYKTSEKLNSMNYRQFLQCVFRINKPRLSETLNSVTAKVTQRLNG